MDKHDADEIAALAGCRSSCHAKMIGLLLMLIGCIWTRICASRKAAEAACLCTLVRSWSKDPAAYTLCFRQACRAVPRPRPLSSKQLACSRQSSLPRLHQIQTAWHGKHGHAICQREFSHFAAMQLSSSSTPWQLRPHDCAIQWS